MTDSKHCLIVVTHVLSYLSTASGVDKKWPFGMSRSMADGPKFVLLVMADHFGGI